MRAESIDKEHVYSVNFVWLCWLCGFLEESRRYEADGNTVYLLRHQDGGRGEVGVECVLWMDGEEI